MDMHCSVKNTFLQHHLHKSQKPKVHNTKRKPLPPVLPLLHMGEEMSKARFKELMQGKKGGRDHVDNLVCAPFEMPTEESNDGWEHVIRHNDACREHVFKDEAAGGAIHASQFGCGEQIDTEFGDACDHFLNHHKGVRDKPFEGDTCMVGNEFNEFVGCKDECVPIKAENADATKRHGEPSMKEMAQQIDKRTTPNDE